LRRNGSYDPKFVCHRVRSIFGSEPWPLAHIEPYGYKRPAGREERLGLRRRIPISGEKRAAYPKMRRFGGPLPSRLA
jgi:hypothetical protein